ncbi:hypothetical protein [Pseudonocardia sp. WMMC193]|uniref:hypothetical protein n=1 Tax=Pseudonocardia sp. WMMC193 TaxID=2911965 RepID=UPI001F344156|nr:hypothetical protein [Pseudonocardia sp. WMMC193]MCF7550412.1 hypothetical protein [Pseudonocardia sp. WMMC193]
MELTRLACPAECRGDRARRAHHDRLLAVETDPDAVVELFETAVTWAELEYPAESTIPPAQWVEFAEKHRWQDPDRALRIFLLAADIARRGARTPVQPHARAVGDGVCPTLVPAPRHLRLAE